MAFTGALESVKKVSIVDYVMIDINCCLKVVFKSRRSKMFSDDDSLNEAIEEESIGKVLFFKVICLRFMKTGILCLMISF